MALSRALLLVSLALAFVQAAPAQQRVLPTDAKRGFLKHEREVLVSVDGARPRLAPGGTIGAQHNLISVPAALPREGAWADYLLDRDGEILRMWLLSADELARPRAA